MVTYLIHFDYGAFAQFGEFNLFGCFGRKFSVYFCSVISMEI